MNAVTVYWTQGKERCGGNYSSHMIIVMGWGKSTSVTFKISNEI